MTRRTRSGRAGNMDVGEGSSSFALNGGSSDNVSKNSIPARLWASSFVATTPSFLFGYCLAALNNVLDSGNSGKGSLCFSGEDPSCARGSLLRDMELSTSSQEIATSLLIAGAWVGCLAASRPSEAIGRRATLLWNNTLFIVGGMMCAWPRVWALFIGRFVCGLAVG
ncbi:unnamed protein product [Discosporangium mesarthrocarpum]